MILKLDKIRLDGGTQAREKLDADAISEYVEAWEAGDEFPAVDVFNDGKSFWLAHGFHRYASRKKAGYSEINCKIHHGSLDDARVFAAGVNQRTGVRRTRKDKAKAVQMLLSSEKGQSWSDHEIAKKAGVSQPFVSNLRKSVITLSAPNDGHAGNGKTSANGEAPKKARSGQVVFDWKSFYTHFGNVARSVGRMEEVYKAEGTPDSNGLRRRISEWGTDFKKWYTKLSNKEAPREVGT